MGKSFKSRPLDSAFDVLRKEVGPVGLNDKIITVKELNFEIPGVGLPVMR